MRRRPAMLRLWNPNGPPHVEFIVDGAQEGPELTAHADLDVDIELPAYPAMYLLDEDGAVIVETIWDSDTPVVLPAGRHGVTVHTNLIGNR